MNSINPFEVKVKDGLPRWRKDMGDITGLADSIKRHGQIQPIVINADKELICGGRRLAAIRLLCEQGNPINATFVYKETIDPLVMREMELEENICRKQMTPAEEVMAVKELHDLMQMKHGKCTGPNTPGWGQHDTAKRLGRSQAGINEDLQLAEALKQFPSLKEFQSKSDMKNAIKGIMRRVESHIAVSKYDNTMAEIGSDIVIQLSNAVDFVESLAEGSIDVILTDPPYGISLDQIKKNNNTGTNHTLYADDKDEILSLYKQLAPQFMRVSHSKSHAYIFHAVQYFETIKGYFEDAGWLVHNKPIIWVKQGNSGQCNAPSCWPASSYETIMYCRREESSIREMGKPDYIICPPVTMSSKIHAVERPIELLQELLKRVALPGATILDCFGGSFSTAEAAIRLGMRVSSCDVNPACVTDGKARVLSVLQDVLKNDISSQKAEEK